MAYISYLSVETEIAKLMRGNRALPWSSRYASKCAKLMGRNIGIERQQLLDCSSESLARYMLKEVLTVGMGGQLTTKKQRTRMLLGSPPT
jgi:hypothetical protein